MINFDLTSPPVCVGEGHIVIPGPGALYSSIKYLHHKDDNDDILTSVLASLPPSQPLLLFPSAVSIPSTTIRLLSSGDPEYHGHSLTCVLVGAGHARQVRPLSFASGLRLSPGQAISPESTLL